MSHEVKSGDFIIVSSDGLWDNLYEDEIAMVLNNYFDGLFLSSYNQNNPNIIDDAINNITNNTDHHKTSNHEYNYTQDNLSSACELLVQRASNAGIKRDDMLIMLIYIE
jgi:serine/threonine protein phosphatase PrpC